MISALKGDGAMHVFDSCRLKFTLILASVGLLLFSLCLPLSQPASAQTVCFALPDLETHTLSGVVNSYYPGVSNAPSGATTLSLGVGRGSGDSIQPGDLLIVIQMQGSFIDSTNGPAYGCGGGSGSGYTDPASVGKYEYVVADNALAYQSGGVLNILGAGVNQGLLNAYYHADAQAGQGQQRFQVVRVPAYLNVMLGGDLVANPWDGSTGGVLAVEAASMLDFDGQSINVSGLGFRGGGGRQLTGYQGLDPLDYRTISGALANGSKGEGISGVSRYVIFAGELQDTQPVTGDGYPNGSQARGAPGNAGGGATDGDPQTNSENSGGGGGGNGGAGGQGGYSAYSSLDIGGRGGAALAESAPGRVILGGGGGAGSNNDSSIEPSQGIESSGGTGGGVVFLRASMLLQPGKVYANGVSAQEVLSDGAGGGGAGGSVVVVTRGTSSNGLLISVRGGDGGSAWKEQPGGSDPGMMHGPGGGGGGGVIFTTGAARVVDVRGGANGVTTTSRDSFGATSGANGKALSGITNASIPGVAAGFECFAPTAVSLVDLSAKPVASTVSHIWIGVLSLALMCGSLWLFFQRRNPHVAV
jgi:hypothetical protein